MKGPKFGKIAYSVGVYFLVAEAFAFNSLRLRADRLPRIGVPGRGWSQVRQIAF